MGDVEKILYIKYFGYNTNIIVLLYELNSLKHSIDQSKAPIKCYCLSVFGT